jgi:thymidylate kinase
MVVDDLDVVARLDDHQRNVPHPQARSRARVVCLPGAPIERALGAGEGMNAMRGEACVALAEEAGGGDGPAMVEHLEGPGVIPRALDAWRRDGVEMLHVVGARAQPGWARALLARWGGGLRFEDAVDESLERRLVEHTRETEYARDPGHTSGCWRGFVPPWARLANQGALRDPWVRRWSERGFSREVRAALLGHDPALEEALRTPCERARLRPVTAAITGVDGSGKSTQVAALAESLTALGLRVRVIKLYRQGAFLELANELSGRSRGGAELGVFRVSRVVKLTDSLRVWRDEVSTADCDVIVFDRYLETHEAAARSQLTWDISQHPALAVLPRVDVEFLLRLDAEVALARIDQRGEMRSADEHPTGLRGYAAWFDRIAARDGFVVLDATADRDTNARAILDTVTRVIATTSPPTAVRPLSLKGDGASHADQWRSTCRRGGSPSPFMERGGADARGEVGGDMAWGAPGDDVCALAGFVRSERPELSAAFPEAFWLEAYAAQVLLDLRAAGAGSAEVALWPAALTRDPAFADLVVLAELERMTLAQAPVRRVTLDGGGAARRLGELLGDPAGRVAARYRQGLEAHARERGWKIETHHEVRP